MNKNSESNSSDFSEGSKGDSCFDPAVNGEKLNETSKRKGKKRSKHTLRIVEWTEEEDKRLFELYKQKGSCWSTIATEFSGRTENQVKNRFYSTLRRLATKHSSTNGQSGGEQVPKTKKKDLLRYVDEAILYGHNCRSKRGRKRKLSSVADETRNNIENNLPSKEDDKNTEAQAVEKAETPIEDPDYVKLLIENNEEALKVFEERVVEENELEDLLKLQREIEERLKSTQEIIGSTEEKDTFLELN